MADHNLTDEAILNYFEKAHKTIKDLDDRLKKIENPNPIELMIHYHKEEFGDDLMELEKHGNFYDVRAAKDVFLKQNCHKLIPLGISIYLPDGYYAELLPRSSTFKNFKFIVANSMGIIDTDYRSLKDQWFLSVIPFEDIQIHKNERIAQFTIVKEVPTILKEGTWEAKARGGHGSSGIK